MRLNRVRITGRDRIGPYHHLRYEWSGTEYPVHPGQFIMARPAGRPGARPALDPFLARPFSIYEREGGWASVLVEVHGPGTREICAAEELEVTPPLGSGFELAAEGPVALVAGDGKVAPLKLLQERLAAAGISHDTFLLLDVEHAGISDYFPEARVVERLPDLGAYRTVYASGHAAFLGAVRAAAGPQTTVQASVEERMACANGSCHGCAVPLADGGYARACVEGPVFDARQLLLG